MTLQQLNLSTPEAFTTAIGWVFEHSPWVAERTCSERPFPDLATLHAAMVAQVKAASREEQMALLGAHPDLGSRARMSDASIGEQAGAGLHQLTAAEFERLHQLNSAYKQKFGFPFLYAVKGSAKYGILEAMARRLPRDAATEFTEALEQVFRIALFRLQDTIDKESE